jgi:hypothetical protein
MADGGGVDDETGTGFSMTRRKRFATYRAVRSLLGLVPALVGAPLWAQDQPVRMRQTGTSLEVQVLRLARELAAHRSVEADLNRMYSTYLVRAEKETDNEVRLGHEQAAQQLRVQLEQAVASRLKLTRELEAICSAGEKPQGWFGVSLQGEVTVSRQSGGANVFRYGEHQTVVTVEPGSPADKAGIRAQDVIVAIAGRDLRAGDVIASELLRPGAKVPVTLQRDGDRQNVIVFVEQRPESFEMTCPWFDRTIATAMAPAPGSARFGYKFTLLPDSSRTVTVRSSRPSASTPPGVARAAVEPTVVYAGPMITPFANGTSIVAGAQLIVMNRDLGEVFGVDDGLLVLKVLSGTPAQQSGLKGGDVLLRANEMRLTSPRVLARVIDVSRGEVKLTILRQKQQQALTLKW